MTGPKIIPISNAMIRIPINDNSKDSRSTNTKCHSTEIITAVALLMIMALGTIVGLAMSFQSVSVPTKVAVTTAASPLTLESTDGLATRIKDYLSIPAKEATDE